jgi:hypothetical protein
MWVGFDGVAMATIMRRSLRLLVTFVLATIAGLGTSAVSEAQRGIHIEPPRPRDIIGGSREGRPQSEFERYIERQRQIRAAEEYASEKEAYWERLHRPKSRGEALAQSIVVRLVPYRNGMAVVSDFNHMILESYQGNDSIGLLRAAFQKLYGNSFAPPTSTELREWAGKVRWQIPDSYIDRDGHVRFDLTGVSKVDILDVAESPYHERLEAQSLDEAKMLLDLEKGRARDHVDVEGVVVQPRAPPPVVVGRALGCCFFVRPPREARAAVARLKQSELTRDNIRILSLVHDSSTEQRLAASDLSQFVVEHDVDRIQIDAIRKILRRHAGRSLIVLGHVEEGSYVVRSADGRRVIFSIELSDLRAMAKEEHVQLIDVGCRTGAELDLELTSVGVINKFNSLVALDRISAGLAKAGNFAEFFRAVAGSEAGAELLIVGDKSVGEITRERVGAALFARGPSGRGIARVGHVSLQDVERDLGTWLTDMWTRLKIRLLGD